MKLPLYSCVHSHEMTTLMTCYVVPPGKSETTAVVYRTLQEISICTLASKRWRVTYRSGWSQGVEADRQVE